MIKTCIEIFNLIAIASIVCIPFFGTRNRGIIALAAVTFQFIIISIAAISIFTNGSSEFNYAGSAATGIIAVRFDYLSAWFILLISFTFLTGAWYGFQYMKVYFEQKDELALHIIAFLLVFTSMIDICLVQNALIILVFWEIMALGSLILIIYEHNKTETLKAGINFLIQSHVCILFLTVAFMWVKIKTGSYDFKAISVYTASQPSIIVIVLFILFFTGFAIKAGFVPFHTWLPLAHPAAPAHISGIMSGVIIKIGIYGILRVLFLIQKEMVSIGYFVLIVSVITGIYGVMLAIVQHNLKKLLAYHSIENIGIIGIGIGLGCLGLGYNNQILIMTGFGGALLHTLNHSLFKSLLFFCAGNIYQAKHTMDIESLGGLLKSLPRSAFLFLIASVAICGLPPFNGFVSEFFIYSGLFNSLKSGNFSLIILGLFAILGLVLIGGLALMCFTKAFGIIFLGKPRKNENSRPIVSVENSMRTAPLYFIGLAILIIGLFPFTLNSFLVKIISMYQPLAAGQIYMPVSNIINTVSNVGWFSLLFLLLSLVFFLVRNILTSHRRKEIETTWTCGYTGETADMQYTASSFIRAYRKLAEPVLFIRKEKKEAHGLYPEKSMQKTMPGDKIERVLIDNPLFWVRSFLNRFVFLQNGNIQVYILYGFIFVGLAIVIPFLVTKISTLIFYLNQL